MAVRLPLGMVGNFDDTETVAQEAFVKAYLSIERLKQTDRFGVLRQS